MNLKDELRDTAIRLLPEAEQEVLQKHSLHHPELMIKDHQQAFDEPGEISRSEIQLRKNRMIKQPALFFFKQL